MVIRTHFALSDENLTHRDLYQAELLQLHGICCIYTRST